MSPEVSHAWGGATQIKKRKGGTCLQQLAEVPLHHTGSGVDVVLLGLQRLHLVDHVLAGILHMDAGEDVTAEL